MSSDRPVVRAAVVGALAEILREPPASILDSQDLVGDLGLDSLNAAQLLVAIERRLSWRVPEGYERELMGAIRVADLVEIVARLRLPLSA
jgi:acyl carrier protein